MGANLNLTPQNQERYRLVRWFPVFLPLLMLGVKIAIHPKYSFAILGFDVAFVGVAFDSWAIMTAASERRVMHGGLFDLPRDAEQRRALWRVEILCALAITAMHYIVVGVFAKMAAPPGPHWMVTGVGVFTALALPYAMIDGTFLSRELKNAP